MAGLVGPLVIALPAQANPTTRYVASGGSDGSACTSSATPCATVSHALSASSSGDTIAVSGTIVDHISVTTAVTIEQWPGALSAVLNGGGSGGSVVTANSGADLTLEGLTVTGGNGAFQGAGINVDQGTLTVIDCSIDGNTGSTLGQGGGISSYQGTVTLTGSSVSGNTLPGSTSAPGGQGGGIYSDLGTLTIDDSTVSGNTVRVGGNNPGGQGGGIMSLEGTLRINDSTIADNSVTTASGPPGTSGALFSLLGTTTITDSTIEGNSAPGGINGGMDFDNGTNTLAGDILAGNGNSSCIGSRPTDGGYNIDDDGTCQLSATGSVSHSMAIDGYLGSLASNGGPTQTIALTPGVANPAQAVIPPAFVAPGQTAPVCTQADQRGVLRASPCDMGSFALTAAALPGAPTGLTATASATAVDLSWAPPVSTGGTGLTGYQVFRGTSPGGESVTPLATVTSTTFVDTSAAPGTTYYFTVKATNGVGRSVASNEAGTTVVSAPAPAPAGYWLVASDGGVFSFGRPFLGSTGGRVLNQPVVAMASTPDGQGYYFAARDGGVFAFGDARFQGSVPGLHEKVNDVVALAVDPGTGGYWLVGADGGVYAFGAPFEGSVPGLRQHISDIVGMAATADGGGYYLVASTGAVDAFGDARYQGSANTLAHLNAPIVGISVDSATGGYWLAGADGGIYAYAAPFHGSAGGIHLNRPIVGLSATGDGSGYYLVASDGGVFAFHAPFLGSMGSKHLNASMVGIALTGQASRG